MNYEERQQEICKMCIEGTKCSYKSRNLEYKCTNLSDNMYGWELGYKDAIEKAYKWLTEKASVKIVEDFKKAMEE